MALVPANPFSALATRIRFGAIVAGALVVAGLVIRPVEAPAWEAVKSAQPEMNLSQIEGALGQGLVVGVLGGLRTILADFMWIRANAAWEEKDRVQLDALLRLTLTLDPRPMLFWFNSARMVAYDVPNWRIREEGGYDTVPKSRQAEIDREQSEQAFALLRQGLEFHPEDARLYLEFAQIYLNRLKDEETAAEWFLLASQKDDAPYFAARIHAELLRRLGRDREAYDFYCGLHRDLPDNPFTQRGVILERIRQLEDELGIPPTAQFVPRVDQDAHHGHHH